MNEEWRPVVGYEGLYEISNLGRIRSLDRVVFQHNKGRGLCRRVYPGRDMKQVLHSRGYLRVSLSGSGSKRRQYQVHCLVAAAFIGPRPPGMHVCHNDCDAFNNRSDNLRYDTPKANVQDSIRQGLRNQLQTHCIRGHEFTEENTRYSPNGKRACRACGRERERVRGPRRRKTAA